MDVEGPPVDWRMNYSVHMSNYVTPLSPELQNPLETQNSCELCYSHGNPGYCYSEPHLLWFVVGEMESLILGLCKSSCILDLYLSLLYLCSVDYVPVHTPPMISLGISGIF